MQQVVYCYSPAAGWDRGLDASLDSPSTLLILFGASNSDAIALGISDLQGAFPQSQWIGCSTAGEIYGGSLIDGALVVAVLHFSRTTLRLASKEIHSPEASLEAGIQLAKALDAPDLKAVFLLTDGLSVNGSELSNGLANYLSKEVVVTGGLAADGDKFRRTWVIVDKVCTANHAVAVGLYGEHVEVSFGSRGGWDIFGPEREVTRSQGNILYELDGQPALSLYKKYLGERASQLPASGLLFPLAIRNPLEEDGLTVRTILAVSEADNSIRFAGDIPQGASVYLMRANFERLIEGSRIAAESILARGTQNEQVVSLAISCVGRRLVLSHRTEEEIEAVTEGLPPNSLLIGFYSYGEISPLSSGRCDLHNQTMTLTSFWERSVQV